MISPVILSDDNEVFLVPSSNAPLYNVSQWNSYYNLRMVFDFVVAGGGYLNSLRNKIFNGVLRFTAYRSDNSVIGYQDVFLLFMSIDSQAHFHPKTSIQYVFRLKHQTDYLN